MRKKIIPLLCLTLLITVLCACSKRVENLDEFESLLISASSETQDTEPFASTVYVIIPKDCSAELAVRAEALVLGIYEKTGINTYLKYDSESIADGEDVFSVLLGNTSHALSRDVLRTVKTDDYVCKYDRGSIVIGGGSDRATLAALDRFEGDILSTATSASLMHASAHFEYFHEYGVDTVKLNGFYLYDYAIKSDASEEIKALGDALKEYIVQKSGYALGKQAPTDKSISILLDKNATEGIAIIECEEQNISIRANSVYGLSAAVARFASLLIPQNAEDECQLTVSDDIHVEYNIEDLDVLVGVAEAGAQKSVDFHVAISEDLYKGQYDAVVFFKIGESVFQYLSYDINGNYNVAALLECDNGASSVICTQVGHSIDSAIGDGRIYSDFKANNGIQWRLLFVDNYDDSVGELLDLQNTLLFVRDNGEVPLKYESFAEFPFSFEGGEYAYRLIFEQKSIDCALSDEEKETIDGSSKTFWRLNFNKRYHESFRVLQDSLN
ncbi:MAG: hypothetical protein E7642_07615 [Ruminococcaceae bacterium]|nr:hypothetical protein [Oscillospiraceae bacterium]